MPISSPNLPPCNVACDGSDPHLLVNPPVTTTMYRPAMTVSVNLPATLTYSPTWQPIRSRRWSLVQPPETITHPSVTSTTIQQWWRWWRPMESKLARSRRISTRNSMQPTSIRKGSTRNSIWIRTPNSTPFVATPAQPGRRLPSFQVFRETYHIYKPGSWKLNQYNLNKNLIFWSYHPN